MNNRRLSTAKSTSSTPVEDREQLMIKVDELLKRPSNIKKMSDGRLFIKSLNKISNASRGNTKVVVQDEDGNILHEFDTITACAKFLDVSNDVVSRTLISKGKSIIKDSKLLYVKSFLFFFKLDFLCYLAFYPQQASWCPCHV